MTNSEILVVEDEERQRRVLVRHLEKAEFGVTAVDSAEAALEQLNGRSFAALVTDLRLPEMDGLELVRRARALDEEMPSIIMTGHGSMETAVEALRSGAHDYILKPLFFDELVRKLRTLLDQRDLRRENARLRAALKRPDESEIVGVSPAMAAVRQWVERAGATDSTVLLVGETGVGKEVVVRAIHAAGPNADEPLLSINVAALPETMVESELFGYERGAFTGAQRQRDGLLRAAGRGTVFLDEIGEMPLPLQAKLLRALEAREVLPLGADRPVPFEARVVCATHRDLPKLVAENEFRQDLYYRLNVLEIRIAPLRDRPEDVAPLAQHLLDRLCRRQRGIQPPVLTAEAVQALSQYSWPGNVRELANVLERAVILTDDDRVLPEHLGLRPASGTGEAAVPGGGGAAGETPTELKAAVEEFERRHIARVLRQCDGNRERAALALGLSQATLYRRLEKLDLKGDRAFHAL